MIIIPFAFVYFLPQIYKPFNKFKPYHGKYRTKIFDLAKEHDVKIKEIVSSKTGFSGAALGLWNNQVIFINSRILKQPWEEIKSLYLHEFAHFKNKDLEFMAVYPAITFMIFSYFSYISRGDFLYIFYMLLLFSVIFHVRYLRILRLKEKSADNYTIKDNPKAWISLIKKGIKHLESKGIYFQKKKPLLSFLHTHPWIYDRIDYAKKYRK